MKLNHPWIEKNSSADEWHLKKEQRFSGPSGREMYNTLYAVHGSATYEVLLYSFVKRLFH